MCLVWNDSGSQFIDIWKNPWQWTQLVQSKICKTEAKLKEAKQVKNPFLYSARNVGVPYVRRAARIQFMTGPPPPIAMDLPFPKAVASSCSDGHPRQPWGYSSSVPTPFTSLIHLVSHLISHVTIAHLLKKNGKSQRAIKLSFFTQEIFLFIIIIACGGWFFTVMHTACAMLHAFMIVL